MGACAFQPLDDRRQPLAVAIIGMDLALVAHGGRHGQRLATAACTEIQHLVTFSRFDQRRDDLRPLVLNLEPALLEAKLGGDIRQA